MAKPLQLAKVSLLASLEEGELREVAELCRSRTFERGEILFHGGDPAEALYILVSGLVKIVLVGADGEETILHVAGPGEGLGELSLVDGEPRSATAVALHRVEALALHRRDFLALLDRHPSLRRAVTKQLAQMVRRVNAEFQDVISLGSTERLAKKLLHLAERHGAPTPQGVRIPRRLTQDDLGRMLGLSRDSISRGLHNLGAEGMLVAGRDGIELRDLDALRGRVAGNGICS